MYYYHPLIAGMSGLELGLGLGLSKNGLSNITKRRGFLVHSSFS